MKDGCPAFLASNVVYKFTCSLDEGISYIGKTERHLFTRVQEHLTPSHNSAVNQHIAQCTECQNKANKSNFSIIRKCQSSQVVSLHESFLIRQLKPILNVQLYNNGGTLLNIFWLWVPHDSSFAYKPMSFSSSHTPMIRFAWLLHF